MLMLPASKRVKSVGASRAMTKPRKTKKKKPAINSKVPNSPNSSEKAAKIKSVVSSS
jgi:hypothetical protein